jgi:cytochrome c-type biogenesis protein CcmH/NrfF
MKRALALLAVVLVAGAGAIALGAVAATAAQGWAYELQNELMSPYCPGRTLADCPSPQAQTLRMWLIMQEAAGRPRAEVEAELTQRYGDAILASPRAEGFGIAAYVVPALLFAGGLALLIWFLRRQTHAAPLSPAAGSGAVAASDPELERLLDEELRDDR